MQASLELLGESTEFGTSAAEFAAEGDQPVLDKSNIVQQTRTDVYERSMFTSMEFTLQVSNTN